MSRNLSVGDIVQSRLGVGPEMHVDEELDDNKILVSYYNEKSGLYVHQEISSSGVKKIRSLGEDDTQGTSER